MKAVHYQRYGGPEVLELVQVERPAPAPHEVQVKVMASTINAADYRLMRANPFITRFYNGLFRPQRKILGIDFAGVVEQVGSNVTEFKVGDEVMGDTFGDDLGGFAEYVCVSESALVKKPDILDFGEAASIVLTGLTSLQAVRDLAFVGPGSSVLIQGAGGGVGTMLVQIAKSFGAAVTAVCGSRSVELVEELGADHVLDYTKTSFAQESHRYDVIFGVNGHCPLSDYKSHLNPGGIYVIIGGNNRQIFEGALLGRIYFAGGSESVSVLSIDDERRRDDIETVCKLVESGEIRPVIDRVYRLEQIREAMTYAEEGHVKGKVIIKVHPAA